MPSARKTILLVEDEAIIALAEKAALEAYGYAVVTAHTGEEALHIANSSASIDLVLMDINLGKGMDGTEAAERILAERELPILFVSSQSGREVVEKTEKISSFGYVVKSSSVTVLDASIKMAFRLFEANRTIRLREMKEEAMISNISDVIGIVDAAGIMTYKSPNVEKCFGWKPEELVGSEGLKTVHPEDLERIRGEVGALDGREGASVTVEFRYLRADGSYTPIELTATNLLHDPGIKGILLNYRDIGERRRSEEAFRARKETAEMLLNVAAEIIISEDLDGRVTLLNDSGHRILGYEPPELIGRNFFELCLPEEIRDEVQTYLRELRDQKAGTVTTHENEVLTKSGERRMIRWRNMVIKGKDGETVGLFSSGEDITERARMAEALRESEIIFNQFLAHSPSLIYIKDDRLRLLKISRNMETLLGRPAAELLGKDSFDLLPPEFARSAMADDMRVLREGTMVETEETLDGRTYSTVKFPMAMGEGKPGFLAGFSVDITERRAAEERIRILLAEKELILKEVHHRVKNNMNAMRSLLALQATNAGEGRARQVLEDAEERMRSMGVLYDRLYRSADHGSLSSADYLSELLDGILSNHPGGGTLRLERRLQDFPLDASRLQPLGIILNELLTNILKYAFVGRGGGLVEVESTLAEGRVRLSVRDDGVGLPEGIDFESSTGFGLQLVAALTSQLGGAIRAERGGGTRILLEFPA